TAKTFLSDTIKNVKFTHISWYGNEGFFYCRYPVRTGNEFVAPSLSQKLFYHKLGEPQQQDRMIFAGEEKDMVRIETRILHNKKKLLISVYSATTGNALHALNLPIKGSLDLETIFSDYPFNFDIVAEVDSMLYLSTNDYAPNNKLVKASIDDLRPKKWKDVIPEGQLPVTFSYCQRKFFSQYVKMAFHEVVQYNLNGDIERPISLPGIGSVSSFSRGHRQIVYYTFTSYLYPSTIYRYDIATGESKPWKTTQVPFSHSDYECKLIFYNSKDGNKVPMMIVHKKGMLLNGNNPVLLTGYGGFGTSLTPFYHPAIIAFLEKGGVYCVPNLRGGGEYGAKWHNAGRLSHKQNTFDDFIAAAEYMVAKGYTKPSLIAASGASNGGLLVGACLTQRPDLFKVCISSGGVFDMLRYQKYTVGGYWAHEYGSADLGSDLFKILYAYSPLHRVKSNTCYPATLMFTGDHDDRVVPFHTYKFTAALQEAQHCDNPILMHVEENAGHVMGKSLKQRTEEDTEKLAFIFQNLGLAY
ncbi:MAG: S9 family peptidase, partial [Chitinophagia bacterium]|nr:S9 family peptidase [Chitinophagia bacterium]